MRAQGRLRNPFSKKITVLKLQKEKNRRPKKKLEDGNRRESTRNRRDQSLRKTNDSKRRMDFKIKFGYYMKLLGNVNTI